MSKHTFTETTEVNNKIFFAGEAELSSDDLKALKETPTGTDATETRTTETETLPTETELGKMNKAELTRTAKAENVEVTDETDTNAKLAQAILGAR